MTHIENLHLEAIPDIFAWHLGKSLPEFIASKSAEITEQIAIDFAEWLDMDEGEGTTNKELFQEFLKSKENDKS